LNLKDGKNSKCSERPMQEPEDDMTTTDTFNERQFGKYSTRSPPALVSDW